MHVYMKVVGHYNADRVATVVRYLEQRREIWNVVCTAGTTQTSTVTNSGFEINCNEQTVEYTFSTPDADGNYDMLSCIVRAVFNCGPELFGNVEEQFKKNGGVFTYAYSEFRVLR